MPFTDQSQYTVRFEWGLTGLRATAADAAVVIVDILTFTTAVSVACGRGAVVFPCEWDTAMALELAAREEAKVAAKRGTEHDGSERFSLSPESLLAAGPGLRLVLPSPNGSAIAYAAMGERHCIVAGSIRNAAAVGDWLSREGESVSIIAAGERWEDGTSRFAVEDLLGAGAIIAHLGGQLSPEAASAAAAFDAVRHDLAAVLQRCSSGRELVERGFAGDVALAAELNVEGGVPILIDGAFRRAS